MTIPAQAEAEALRRAAQFGDFAATERLTSVYVAALQPALSRLPPAEAVHRLHEACGILDWSRRCLCAARGRVNDQLRRVHRLSAYRQPHPETVSTWKLVG